MFGITTFAQAPFSTLAGAGSVFSVAVNETATGADTTSSILAFLANIAKPLRALIRRQQSWPSLLTLTKPLRVLMFCQQSWPSLLTLTKPLRVLIRRRQN
jgi:hypothetical protein